MAFAAGDIVRVALNWVVNDVDSMVNVHPVILQDVTGLSTDVDLVEALASILLSELYDNVLAAVADNVVGTVLTAQNLTTGQPYPATAWGANGESSASELLPMQTTPLVYINGATPRRQGRVYLPAYTENHQLDTGLISSGAMNTLLAFTVSLLDPLTDGTVAFQRVICDRNGNDPELPTYGGVSTAYRTQRRRTPGRGA